MCSGTLISYQIETLMEQEFGTHHQERNVPANALHAVADALPAFGIVAAVLGVIKALASVDQPPAVLADLISKAMEGTRSEESRVGKECDSTSRSRWSP